MSNGTIAPLSNVLTFTQLVEKVVERPSHLPGIGCFSGNAGLGKTYAAMYAMNDFRAYHVEVRWAWTQKPLCEAILAEMGHPSPANTVYKMIDQIAEVLACDPTRPLLLDEADHLERKNTIEVVRDIYRGCGVAGGSIILIGEQHLPNHLKKWERVHSRILDFATAAPVTTEDVSHLAGMHCPDFEIAPDMLEKIRKVSRGSARRVVVNLNEVNEQVNVNGWETVTTDLWGDRALSAGGY